MTDPWSKESLFQEDIFKRGTTNYYHNLIRGLEVLESLTTVERLKTQDSSWLIIQELKFLLHHLNRQTSLWQWEAKRYLKLLKKYPGRTVSEYRDIINKEKEFANFSKSTLSYRLHVFHMLGLVRMENRRWWPESPYAHKEGHLTAIFTYEYEEKYGEEKSND